MTLTRGTFAAEGIPARLSLAIIQSVAILYANVGPVIVSGLAQKAAFTAETAGYVLAMNIYGTALGGLLVLLLLKRLDWRMAAKVLLIALVFIDLATSITHQPALMFALRFTHGLAGGMLMGILLSVISRVSSPERTLGLAVGFQVICSGLLSAVTTPLLTTIGMNIIWYSLIAATLTGFVLLQFLGPYPMDDQRKRRSRPAGRAGMPLLVLAMLGVLVFQMGEMGAWAYVVELGNLHEFSAPFIGNTLAVALWTGGLAAMFVTWWGTRSGRLKPLLASTVSCAFAIGLLALASPAAFIIGNVLFGISFCIAISYMFGVGAELDNSGHMGAMTGFVSNLGLSLGPVAGGYLAGKDMLIPIFVLGALMVLAAAALLFTPATVLDRRNLTGRVRW